MIKLVSQIFLLSLLSAKLLGQDTSAVWLKNIDTTDFKVIFSKKAIPDVLLKYMGVDKLSQIANPGEDYASGCVVRSGQPRKRLNWVAKDKKNHVVVSISVGGKAHRTRFFFINKENGKYNINELAFGRSFSAAADLTFGSATNKIKTRQFEFIEFDPSIDDKN